MVTCVPFVAAEEMRVVKLAAVTFTAAKLKFSPRGGSLSVHFPSTPRFADFSVRVAGS